MNLDLELFRSILVAVKNASSSIVKNNYSIRFEGVHPTTTDYRIHWLIQEGFLAAIDPESKDREYDYINIKLTSKGRQLLDILTNKDNFERARAILEDSAIPMTLDALLSAFTDQ